MTENKPLELYIHIPFCVRKCNYCDFLSAPADKRIIHRYMASLREEAVARKEAMKEPVKEPMRRSRTDYEISSIFLGGGTPSMADPEDIRDTLDCIRGLWSWREDAEITIEVNPGTVDERALDIYRQSGVNRLSIGLQSVHERELEELGRIHGPEDFFRTYEDARRVGFSNINVDLMSGLPGQTLSGLGTSLERVTALVPPPEHISVYSLIVEEGTNFHRSWERGELVLPDEEEDRRMYEYTGDFLRARGYDAYEISNYARPGYACRHNMGYWTRQEYLGLGIGAASLMNEARFTNGRDLEAYLDKPQSVWGEPQSLGRKDRMEEMLFLGLRLGEGVSRSSFQEVFGQSMTSVYGRVIDKNIEDGLLEERAGSIRLTGYGRNLANYVMAQFLQD